MEQVLGNMKRKTKVAWELPKDTPLAEDTVYFASQRYGSVPGTHSLFFDSPADTIEITHTARNREGFALGAVIAAEWLVRSGPGKDAGKPRHGIFTMDDVLKEILP
jgi:4-hydroxy-tetrahydrodipicolinate reductase